MLPIRSFGRRAPTLAHGVAKPAALSVSDELRLFLLTFAGGFVFMTVYLA